MTVILLRQEGIESDQTAGANYLKLGKWQAQATGNITEIRVTASGNGNIKLGIYTDNAGEPDDLLSSVGSTAITTGENVIPITSTPVVSGTYYWLAYNIDQANIPYKNTGGTNRYKVLTYATAFPDPAGTGFSTGGKIGRASCR